MNTANSRPRWPRSERSIQFCGGEADHAIRRRRQTRQSHSASLLRGFELHFGETRTGRDISLFVLESRRHARRPREGDKHLVQDHLAPIGARHPIEAR